MGQRDSLISVSVKPDAVADWLLHDLRLNNKANTIQRCYLMFGGWLAVTLSPAFPC